MSAPLIICLWLAANYAVAAMLVYHGARRLGADRAGARVAAAAWPQAMFGVALSHRAIWRRGLRGGAA
jgi:hypothetical protein